MKLVLALALTIITMCQLAIMALAYDTWQMDKQFFEDMNKSNEGAEDNEKEVDRYA